APPPHVGSYERNHIPTALSLICRCRRRQFAAVALALISGAMMGRAQYLEPPEPLATAPRARYVRLDVEAERSHLRSASGATSSFQRLYVSPVIGFTWDYYVYHPDLLNFNILAEPGYVWQKSGPTGELSTENDFLLNGSLKATFLQLKPYATTLFAHASHDTHQYDFFNTVTEDVRAWGAASGYTEGPVPVTASFEQSERDTTGFDSHSVSDLTTFNLHAQNERMKRNVTDLSYQF